MDALEGHLARKGLRVADFFHELDASGDGSLEIGELLQGLSALCRPSKYAVARLAETRAGLDAARRELAAAERRAADDAALAARARDAGVAEALRALDDRAREKGARLADFLRAAEVRLGGAGVAAPGLIGKAAAGGGKARTSFAAAAADDARVRALGDGATFISAGALRAALCDVLAPSAARAALARASARVGELDAERAATLARKARSVAKFAAAEQRGATALLERLEAYTRKWQLRVADLFVSASSTSGSGSNSSPVVRGALQMRCFELGIRNAGAFLALRYSVNCPVSSSAK